MRANDAAHTCLHTTRTWCLCVCVCVCVCAGGRQRCPEGGRRGESEKVMGEGERSSCKHVHEPLCAQRESG